MCVRVEVVGFRGTENRQPEGGAAAPVVLDFGELWQAHAADLFQRCLAWTGGRRTEAEEAFSRASLQIFLKYPSHGDRLRDPRAWMLRIARNACVDVFREDRRRREELLDSEPPAGAAELPIGGTLAADPERLLLGKELRTFLLGSIEELPSRLRETVQSHLDLADPRSTADHLAISEVNLRKRLQLARDRLRERLASYRAGRARLPGPGETPPTAAPAPPWLGKVEALRWLEGPVAGRPAQLLALRHRPDERRASSPRALERYVREHPSGWTRRLDLAREHLRAGRLPEGAAQLEAVVARQPRRLEPWLELAAVHQVLAGPEAAREVCARGCRAVSGEGARLYLQGLEAQLAGRREEAVLAWRSSAAAMPATAAPWIALAELEEGRGRPTRAVEALEIALSLEPEDQTALAFGRISLRLAGRRYEGEGRDERGLERDPSNPLALVRWLAAHTRAGAERGEIAGLAQLRRERLEQLAASSPTARRGLAVVHLAAREPEVAGRLLAELALERPQDPLAWTAFARLLERQGRLVEAWSFWKKARQVGPPGRELALLGCRLAARVGEAEAVSRFVAEGPATEPEAWDVVSTAAWSLCLLEASSEPALELSRRALELEPRLPAAWIEHGRILAHGGRWDQALETLEHAWGLLPEGDGWDLAMPLALDLCRLQLERGDPAAAARWRALALGAAEALRPHDPARAEQALRRAGLQSKGFLRELLLAGAGDD